MTYTYDCTFSMFLLSFKCFVVQWHRVKHVSMRFIMAEVILHYLDKINLMMFVLFFMRSLLIMCLFKRKFITPVGLYLNKEHFGVVIC